MSAHRKELILAIMDIGRRKLSMSNTLRLEMKFGSRALRVHPSCFPATLASPT